MRNNQHKELNEVRLSLKGRSFSAKEAYQFPGINNSNFKSFLDHKVIKRIARGKYVFWNRPIYKELLETIAKERNDYYRNYYNQVKLHKEEHLKDIANAIELLKAEGYHIYKMQIVEVLNKIY